jgi:hypothetical protein
MEDWHHQFELVLVQILHKTGDQITVNMVGFLVLAVRNTVAIFSPGLEVGLIQNAVHCHCCYVIGWLKLLVHRPYVII